MTHMPRITKLKLFNGSTLAEWIDATRTYNVWNDARRVIADWADCDLAEIDAIENDIGGEFITVDGIPTAYLEWETVPHPSARQIPITVNQIAAE
jgi:hypothetical protein